MKKYSKHLIAFFVFLGVLTSNMSVLASPGPHDGYNWFGLERSWGSIYDVISGDQQGKDYMEGGDLLEEILAGLYRPEAIEMFLDFGYFTNYAEYFKSQGYIPASYQLPATYYTVTKTNKVLFTDAWGTKRKYIVTDCPEGQAFFNRYAQVMTKVRPVPPLLGNAYVPKYQRDMQVQSTTTNASSVSNVVITEDKFDYDYYAKMNPDVVAVLGKDKKSMYKHYITYGISENRAVRSK